MSKQKQFFGRIFEADFDKLRNLNKSNIIVFLKLKILAGGSDSFYITQSDLAQSLSLSFSTVQKSIAALKKSGLITIEQRGRKLANIYHFDTHHTVSNTDIGDTHHTVSNTPPCDTHRTVSNHKLEKEKDNNYNYNSNLISQISSLWGWDIDPKEFKRICAKHPKCNHSVELLILDGWLRKKGRKWANSYALRGIAAWFSNVNRRRNKIPGAYRSYVHPSLMGDSPINGNPSKSKSQVRPAEKTEMIPIGDKRHEEALRNAPDNLRRICSSLEIEEGKMLRSFQLKGRFPSLEMSGADAEYVRSHQNYEGFIILESIFELQQDVA